MTQVPELRNVRLEVRVSSAEKRAIVRKVPAAGLSTSAFLRAAMEEYDARLAFERAVSDRADAEASREPSTER